MYISSTCRDLPGPGDIWHDSRTDDQAERDECIDVISTAVLDEWMTDPSRVGEARQLISDADSMIVNQSIARGDYMHAGLLESNGARRAMTAAARAEASIRYERMVREDDRDATLEAFQQ